MVLVGILRLVCPEAINYIITMLDLLRPFVPIIVGTLLKSFRFTYLHLVLFSERRARAFLLVLTCNRRWLFTSGSSSFALSGYFRTFYYPFHYFPPTPFPSSILAVKPCVLDSTCLWPATSFYLRIARICYSATALTTWILAFSVTER